MRGKLIAIVLISVLLSIALFMVSLKIQERSYYRETARMELARIWTDQQRIVGPIIVVPYREEVRASDRYSGLVKGDDSPVIRDRLHFVLPEDFSATADLSAETRYLGIHEIPVYDSSVRLQGNFIGDPTESLRQRSEVIEVGEPFIAVAITDMRGIVDTPSVAWNGAALESSPGSRLPFQAQGFHVPLPTATDGDDGALSFDISFQIRGMSALAIAPVGNSTQVRMTSDWPHPSFNGPYPPLSRTIGDEGFEADWRTTGLATNMSAQIAACKDPHQCPLLYSDLIRVELVDPVDIYLQSARATKYGILFIGLTFGTFLLCEVFRGERVHPMQYTLVGLALSIFYLLLLALSEHIPFAAAYAVATLACGGLIGGYVQHVLRRGRLAALLSGALFGLYGVLYTIIQAEDFALLMGTLLLFSALATLMWSTRKVDWSDLPGRRGGERVSAG